MTIYIISIVLGYIGISILWEGKQKLEEQALYKGSLMFAYSGVLGIVGVTIGMLQTGLLENLGYAESFSMWAALLLFAAIGLPIYFFIVKKKRLSW